MILINIKITHMEREVMNIDVNDIYISNLFRNIYTSLKNIKHKEKSQFYLTSNINYYNGEICRISISKIYNEGCSIRLFKGDYGKILFDMNISTAYKDQLIEFLENIFNYINTELCIGTQKISIIFTEKER